MPIIEIHTEIYAPIKRVFDLARSIDLHKISACKSNETVIAGKTSGLINLHEFVTWRAKHLGFYQTLSSKITQFEAPIMFVDEMQKGAFKSFIHYHLFEEDGEKTVMKDQFNYTAPCGILGKLVNLVFLKKYMTRLLVERNKVIKEFAESDLWKIVLPT